MLQKPCFKLQDGVLQTVATWPREAEHSWRTVYHTGYQRIRTALAGPRSAMDSRRQALQSASAFLAAWELDVRVWEDSLPRGRDLAQDLQPVLLACPFVGGVLRAWGSFIADEAAALRRALRSAPSGALRSKAKQRLPVRPPYGGRAERGECHQWAKAEDLQCLVMAAGEGGGGD